jgi:hypothetical protein
MGHDGFGIVNEFGGPASAAGMESSEQVSRYAVIPEDYDGSTSWQTLEARGVLPSKSFLRWPVMGDVELESSMWLLVTI